MTQSNRHGFTFCICPDGQLIKEYIHTLVTKQEEDWKVLYFWADDEIPDTYWQNLTWTNLLGRPTAVVMRRAEHFKADGWKKLHPILGRFRQGVWPFFCLEKEWERGKAPIPAVLQKQAFWKVAEKKGWVWRSAGLDRKAVQRRVKQWAEAHGVSMAEHIQSVLVQALPLDAAGLKNELEKLELLLAERKVMQTQDLHVLSFQPDLDIFGFIRALQGKGQEIEVWRTILRTQLGGNVEMVMPFLALIVREARILWQLQAGEQEKVWMPGRVKAEKTQMAQRLGPKRLSRLWTMALEAEAGIKSGDLSQSQAQELVVSRMMQVFSHYV
jgi:DNA polymerase-3 subunit delta